MAFLRTLWSYVIRQVKKPVRNYNAVDRAEKTLNLEKRAVSPRYPGTEKNLEKLLKSNPSIKMEIDKKPEDLLKRLKIVKVSSTDESPKIEFQGESRPLPQTRQARWTPDFGYEEPKVISEGKCTLRQALEFITKSQTESEVWTVQKIAKEYKLNPLDAVNVVNNFRTFYVIYNWETRKGVASSKLQVLGAHRKVYLERKYGDISGYSSKLVNEDTEKR